jgi:NAD(P)-dependent dehydrogenase (short-subunit alcohol dehydrogenase family)
MPIDWEKFDSEIDSIIESSAEATDEKLASKISSITRMTDDEVQELFPYPADVKKLAELMKIVKSEEERNTKISNIVSNAEKFGGIVLTLLEKFA